MTLVALGVGSILFDGLSQTQIFFDLFGAPGILVKTLLLIGFLGILVGAARASPGPSASRRPARGCSRSRSATSSRTT